MTLSIAQSRAGWVAYPITLVFCWIFFHLIKRDQDVTNLVVTKKSVLKILTSIPVTILISLAILFMLVKWWGPFVEETTEKAVKDSAVTSQTIQKSIVDRSSIASITNMGKIRFNGWRQGVEVAREQTFFGMGYESFRWHKEILEKVEGSYLQRSGLSGLNLDTPHNIFVQLFVSGGVVGLFLWSFVVFYTLLVLVADCIRNKIYFNVCVALSIVSFHIFGIFQSMQYVPMIWFLIFLMFGYALTIDDGVVPLPIRRFVRFFSKISIVLVFIGGVVYLNNFESRGLAEKYGLEFYEKNQDSNRYFGFYWREKWPMGYYRWSGPRASVVMRRAQSGERGAQGEDGKRDGWMNGGVVEFDIQCHTPGVEKEPVNVVISLDGERIDEVCFVRKGSVKRQYYVKGNTKDQGHEFIFDVSRTWNPKKLGISEDMRDLGVGVSEGKLLEKMPKDGVGFYKWEIWGGGAIPGWPEGKEKRVRWTGRRASLPMRVAQSAEREAESGGWVDGWEVFLWCGHPDIEKEGVGVKILGDGDLLRMIEFTDHGAKRVVLGEEELRGKEVLTFEVSRTWNPKRMGVSEDGRDLGVAVSYRYGLVDTN